MLLSTIGAFVPGLIGAGLPEIVRTQLVVRCRVPTRVAVATSVFVPGVTATAGAMVHALSASPGWYVVGWRIPGVVGGTVCTKVGRRLPSDHMETALGAILALVGGLVLAIELLAA